jgi:hypothetical protein
MSLFATHSADFALRENPAERQAKMKLAEQRQDVSPATEEIYVGTYGRKWMRWMKEHHPKLAQEMV